MSTKPEASETPPKKGKGMAFKLIAGLALVGAGGGGAFAAMQAGLFGGKAEVKEDKTPKLVRKGDEDPYAPVGDGKKGEELAEVHGDGGSEYRTSYSVFADEFTSNLKGSDALVQVSLACSTRRDGRVLMWLAKHELALRSAMLQVLADTNEADLVSMEGKTLLQQRLTRAINDVLIKAEGFGGVDAVYFKSIIVQ